MEDIFTVFKKSSSTGEHIEIMLVLLTQIAKIYDEPVYDVHTWKRRQQAAEVYEKIYEWLRMNAVYPCYDHKQQRYVMKCS